MCTSDRDGVSHPEFPIAPAVTVRRQERSATQKQES